MFVPVDGEGESRLTSTADKSEEDETHTANRKHDDE